MITIDEDYVSFEVAKLLREKGFDESCYQKYDDEGYLSFNHGGYINDQKPDEDFSALAPTHQMAMKWLREIHNIYIDISPTYSGIEKTIYFIWQVFDSNYDGIGDCEIFYCKYEQACEDAIKYCLEDLV